MMPDKPVVLMVEDNVSILHLNRMVLERQGYDVYEAETLKKARELVSRLPRIDIGVLDIILPDGSGLDFAGELKRLTGCPVLMLTSKSGHDDIVGALRGKADDYMIKPYRLEELTARVAVLLEKKANSPVLNKEGSLLLDIPSGRAYVSGKDLLLQPKEFAVLLLLSGNEGKTLTAETLYEKVWKMPMRGDSAAVKSAISRLRKKLLDSGYEIRAERGSGYRFGKEE